MRCLIIADDLTGGADSGVQFAKKGAETFFLTPQNLTGLDLSGYSHSDVLVVNTDSRGKKPNEAFSALASVMNAYDESLYPIIFKKIDSTLRGNIGHEIDAILQKLEASVAFIAPSLPEQNRTLVGGIMMIAGVPVALTEMAHDAVSPVKESHICPLIRQQSRHRVAWIDLTFVSSGYKRLKKAVLGKIEKGARIIIFDAARNEDLANIAEVAFCLDKTPLLVGSAGLAEEVAKRAYPLSKGAFLPSVAPAKVPLSHFFIVSGTASSVTHKQLEKLEMNRGIIPFEIDRSLIAGAGQTSEERKKDLCRKIVKDLMHGHAVLRAPSRRISSTSRAGPPIHVQITLLLGAITRMVLQGLGETIDLQGLALVLTGGETAMSVLDSIGVEGVEIERELIGGIVMSRVHEGNMAGLAMITKAGAFGEEDALEKIVGIAGTERRQKTMRG